MIGWRTPFELRIPGHLPDEMPAVAATRHIAWWNRGLRLKVSGRRLSARYNENSTFSTAPVLRAVLEPAQGGTLVVGYVQWTVLLGEQLVWGLSTLLCVGLSVAFFLDGEAFLGGGMAGSAVFSVAILALGLWSAGAARLEEEERLRRELLRRLRRGGR